MDDAPEGRFGPSESEQVKFFTMESLQPIDEALAKSYTLTLPSEREKFILFGSINTCYLITPHAPNLIVKVGEQALTWQAGTYLSPSQKRTNRSILLTLHGTNCLKCGENLSVDTCTIEHILKGNRDHNCFHNCLPWCHTCNSGGRRTGRVRVRGIIEEKERENAAHEQYAEASSEETRRAAKMRPRWNKWLEELKFSRYSLKGLSLQAPHALGMGSSITYRRYIEEDIAAGILGKFFDDNQEECVYWIGKDTRMIRDQKEREKPQ